MRIIHTKLFSNGPKVKEQKGFGHRREWPRYETKGGEVHEASACLSNVVEIPPAMATQQIDKREVVPGAGRSRGASRFGVGRDLTSLVGYTRLSLQSARRLGPDCQPLGSRARVMRVNQMGDHAFERVINETRVIIVLPALEETLFRHRKM